MIDNTFKVKDCFSSEDMFFGGAKYKYSWAKHSEYVNKDLEGLSEDKVAKRIDKLNSYKDFDGAEFVYNVDYPCDSCILKTNKGGKLLFNREWCEKVK